MVSAPRSCAVGWTKENWKEDEKRKKNLVFGRCFAVFAMVPVYFSTIDGVMMVWEAQISYFIGVQARL